MKNNKLNKRELKIGIIQQSPDIGGAETFMFMLIKDFLVKKNRIYFAANKSKFLSLVKTLPIRAFEIPVILDIMGNFRGLIKSIFLLPLAFIFYINLLISFKKEKVDIILMSNFSEKLLVTFLSIFFKIPVVWIEYGPLKDVFKRNFYIPKIVYRSLKNIPKKIITPSKNTYISLINDAKIFSSKIKIIPCGIDNNYNQKKINNYQNKIVIGNVSRLTKEKGQEYLIKAMPYVLKNFPNAILLLIGEGPDKIYYQNLISELKLEACIKLLGFQKNMDQDYSSMDIFVFPTIWELEGFGLVVVEAMSHKIPVIGSNIGPVKEIIENQKTGILVPPKNEKAIAKAIIHLIKNGKKRKDLGEKGYKRFLKNYKINNISKEILNNFWEAKSQTNKN